MLVQPSAVLDGLVWHGDFDSEGNDTWIAEWQGQTATGQHALNRLLGSLAEPPALQFEAWLAFGLGLEGFAAVIRPSEWADLLNRGPIDPETGQPDGEPVPAIWHQAPHWGRHGLEGLIIHPSTGHVLRALTQGLPQVFGREPEHPALPILVALTSPGRTSSMPEPLA